MVNTSQYDGLFLDYDTPGPGTNTTGDSTTKRYFKKKKKKVITRIHYISTAKVTNMRETTETDRGCKVIQSILLRGMYHKLSPQAWSELQAALQACAIHLLRSPSCSWITKKWMKQMNNHRTHYKRHWKAIPEAAAAKYIKEKSWISMKRSGFFQE